MPRLLIEPWPASCAQRGVQAWQVAGDDLAVTVNARQGDGPTPGVRDVLRAAGVPEDLLTVVPARREAVLLETGPEAPAGFRRVG